MKQLIFYILCLISNVQLSNSSHPVQSLSSISLKSLIPSVILGKFDVSSLRFYISCEDGVDILAAFLTKHFQNYDQKKFKQELECINASENLSCLLSTDFYKEIKGRKPLFLFIELFEMGLFATLVHSDNPVLAKIKDRIRFYSKQFMPASWIDLIDDFIFSLPTLKNFEQLETLCPILLQLVRLKEFNKSLGEEIIKINAGYLSELMEWMEAMRLPIGNPVSLKKRPLKCIRDRIEAWNYFPSEFSFRNSNELYRMLKLPTKDLIPFVSSYERGLIVFAFLLVRAKFDISIDGGESNSLKSQLLAINSNENYYIRTILNSDTGNIRGQCEHLMALLSENKFEDYENFSNNPIHLAIRGIYNLIGWNFYNVEDDSNLVKIFSRSNLGMISFFRQFLSGKFDGDRPHIRFLSTLMYTEVGKVFKFIFDKYFESLQKMNRKIGDLKAVDMILSAAWFVDEARALQLIRFINFEDSRATNNVLNHLSRLSWNVKIEIIRMLRWNGRNNNYQGRRIHSIRMLSSGED
jgi:hypothetical protein